MKWLTAVLMTSSLQICAVRATAQVEIPPGFELVVIVDDDKAHRSVNINNCGEIVHHDSIVGVPGDILHYDNGIHRNITLDEIQDEGPDINEEGTITWGADVSYQDYNSWITVLPRGELPFVVGRGKYPLINAAGHVAWSRFFRLDCSTESHIFLYDGETVRQVTQDSFSNQAPSLNDLDALSWTKYSLCIRPWYAWIMLDDGEQQIALHEDIQGVEASQNVTLNNLGEVIWQTSLGADDKVLFHWQEGVTTRLTDGMNATLNNLGDVYFIRWQPESRSYDAFVYYRSTDNPRIHRLTDDREIERWNGDGDINDWGEAAWTWIRHRLDPTGGITYLRRIRTGEADFDGDVDLDDAASLHDCLTGPGDFDRLCDCRFLDIDHDRDVDLGDFVLFQRNYTGAK
jgi:hypothetical protein